jgi:RNA polymerase sigma-70 factor, ECF subfamily
MQTGIGGDYSARRDFFVSRRGIIRWVSGFLFRARGRGTGTEQVIAMTLLPWRREAPKAEGEGVTFASLALPLVPALYNLALWLTRNAADAEDLVQETLLKALRGFAGFEPGTNFKAWIFRILRNTYLTSQSGLAAMRTVALEEEMENSGQFPDAAIDTYTPETHLLRMRDADALRAAMGKLPPHLLEMIVLCDVEEMKYREIAMVAGVPIGTVMSRIARARAQLRRELGASSASSWEAHK